MGMLDEAIGVETRLGAAVGTVAGVKPAVRAAEGVVEPLGVRSEEFGTLTIFCTGAQPAATMKMAKLKFMKCFKYMGSILAVKLMNNEKCKMSNVSKIREITNNY